MRFLLASALTLLPGIASALSCLPPNPGRELNAWADRGKVQHVVTGTLTRDDPPPQRAGYTEVTAEYRLRGVRYFDDGTEAAYSARIAYRSGCAASWCGRIPPSGTTGLFLVRPRGKSVPLVSTGPCGGGHYKVPDDRGISALKACLQAGRCSGADLQDLGYRR